MDVVRSRSERHRRDALFRHAHITGSSAAHLEVPCPRTDVDDVVYVFYSRHMIDRRHISRELLPRGTYAMNNNHISLFTKLLSLQTRPGNFFNDDHTDKSSADFKAAGTYLKY